MKSISKRRLVLKTLCLMGYGTYKGAYERHPGHVWHMESSSCRNRESKIREIFSKYFHFAGRKKLNVIGHRYMVKSRLCQQEDVKQQQLKHNIPVADGAAAPRNLTWICHDAFGAAAVSGQTGTR